jgi:hypothetical protein
MIPPHSLMRNTSLLETSRTIEISPMPSATVVDAVFVGTDLVDEVGTGHSTFSANLVLIHRV